MSRATSTALGCLLAASTFLGMTVRSAPADALDVLLTLDPPAGSTNRVSMEVVVAGISDTDTADMTGTIQTRLQIGFHQTTAQPTLTGITLTGGDLNVSDIHLEYYELFGLIDVDADGRNIAATPGTTPAVSAVTGSAGSPRRVLGAWTLW